MGSWKVQRVATIAVLAASLVSPLGAQEVLSNQSVIDMVVGKLPKDIIIEKIRSTPAAYDVSPAALVQLNQAKVPKDVIKLMMLAPRGSAGDQALPKRAPDGSVRSPPLADGGNEERTPASETPLPVTARPPARKPKAPLASVPTEVGLHLRADGASLIYMEAIPFTAAKTSNALGAALTGGISKAKLKAVINGAEAAIRIDDPYPEFYFIFEASTASLGGSNEWWGKMTSPNEFSLLKLEKKQRGREVVTGAYGAFSAQTGTDEKAAVPFTFTRIKPGVYKVVPRGALAPGEYAFMPAGMNGLGAAGIQKVFDFGVEVY